MGWSIDLLVPKIDEIFGKVRHEVVMPDAVRPYVYFNYEGEINIVLKEKLVALFPPDVYVIFHPNTLDADGAKQKDQEFPQGKDIKTVRLVKAKVESPLANILR